MHTYVGITDIKLFLFTSFSTAYIVIVQNMIHETL